jgi:hypothetical protein
MAYNDCGNLGPTATNIVFPYDLDKVSTLVPFQSGDSSTRLGTRQLFLSDLATDCPTEPPTSTDRNYFYSKNVVNRCNPRLNFPGDIKYWGLPYYNHCNVQGNKYGLYDPPAAVSPVAQLLSATTTTTALPFVPSMDKPPAAVPAVDQLFPTSTAKSALTKASPTKIPSNTAESDPGTNLETKGTQIIPVPDPPTQTPGDPTPEENQSVGANTATNSQFFPVLHITPTATLLNLGTVASAVISAAPGGKTVVVGSQTVTQGGDAATISNVVISLGDLGLEVKSPVGIVTTIPVPAETVVKATATLDEKPGSTKGRSLTLVGAPSVSAIPFEKTIPITAEMADPLSHGLVVTTKDGKPVTFTAGTQPSGFIVTTKSGKLTTITAGGHSLPLASSITKLSVGLSLSAALANSRTTIISLGTVANAVEKVTVSASQSSSSGSGQDSAATERFSVSLSTVFVVYSSSIALLVVITLT